MSSMSLPELAEAMREIDITMLSTFTDGGLIASRPMSNNGEVAYEGTSYYFTWAQSRMVKDIERNPFVHLGFQGSKTFLVSVQGKATLIRDKAQFEKHWTTDLDNWFEDGIDTDGVVMIKVTADRIHYWDGEDGGEVELDI